MSANSIRGRSGTGLVVVILIMAFIAAVGTSLVMLTSMGSKMAGGMRFYDEALEAAEAGFEAARSFIEGNFLQGTWTTFDGHYVVQPTGIDVPLSSGNPNPAYFRCRTDEELLADFDTNGDGTPNVSNLLYFHQTYIANDLGLPVTRYVYTAFLINDEAGGGSTVDHRTALLVCIGAVRDDTRLIKTARLEIELGI